MPYTVTGSMTFSNQANRDAALTRINAAITGLMWIGFLTALPAGVTTSGTTVINISLRVTNDDETTAANIAKSILDAAVSSNRHTSGYIGVNKT